MPRGKHLKVIIAIDGSCSVDALNFTGSACRVATLEITSMLGGDVTGQHDRPEARLHERASQAEREGAR
ncbi:MAG: DUF2997 domain-containing protein [Phycisphaerales bacterium]|nr:DUF2997 domain-containing protein [Phycisphaerales bacterium]